jgi:type II secretory pathway pseudopilin PulG
MAAMHTKSRDQEGYILLAVMLLMTLMLIALSIELPRIHQQIKRDKEEEMIHRAREYTRAIRLFYRKFGRYPLSVEQLENTNNFRFLRKRYKDPFTGKDDWRLIHQGEVIAKVGGGTTTLNNGFNSGFGQPTPTPTPTPTPQGSGGISGGENSGSPPPSPSPGGSSGSAFGNPQPGGGPIIGVGGTRKEESIRIIDEKDHYNEWVFYYDPRQEQIQQIGPPPPGPTPTPTATPTPKPG